ncbi:hypothetical protein ACFFRR_004557 [Megaselia abdita]
MSSTDEGVDDPYVKILQSKKFKKKVGRPRKVVNEDYEKPIVKVKRKNMHMNTTKALKKKIGIKSYKIPQTVFEKARILINFPEPERVQSKCHSYIQNVKDYRRMNIRNGQEMQVLSDLRQCVLQRDWIGLMKILSIVKPYSHQESVRFFPLCIRYALICLAHNRGFNLLDDFLQGVALSSTEDEKLELFREMVRFD